MCQLHGNVSSASQELNLSPEHGENHRIKREGEKKRDYDGKRNLVTLTL